MLVQENIRTITLLNMVINKNLVPTGRYKNVKKSIYDFSNFENIGKKFGLSISFYLIYKGFGIGALFLPALTFIIGLSLTFNSGINTRMYSIASVHVMFIFQFPAMTGLRTLAPHFSLLANLRPRGSEFGTMYVSFAKII